MAHWVEEEKEEFKKQLQVHGKNWRKIATIIKNKTEKQIRNFYQNYKKKLCLEDLLPKTERGRGKKHESSHSGLKRVRSFNKSLSPVKHGNKRKKVNSNSSESSLNLKINWKISLIEMICLNCWWCSLTTDISFSVLDLNPFSQTVDFFRHRFGSDTREPSSKRINFSSLKHEEMQLIKIQKKLGG